MEEKSLSKIQSIVIGSLNTDIIAAGVDKLLGPGELTFGGNARIGPGGKSRNIAQMIAAYSGKGKVALLGKTVKDPFNLWSVPYTSLQKAGVNTDFVAVESYQRTGKLPGLALIPVDKNGNNQLYVLPGINNDFRPHDLDACSALFEAVQARDGFLGITLELPLETAEHALALAERYKIRVVLDPGGIDESGSYRPLLSRNIAVIKPNEHEAELLTGIHITDLKSAEAAGQRLLEYGIRKVLITHGEKGAYLITRKIAAHITVPKVPQEAVVDSTGCGDQVTAILIAELISNSDIETAARIAIAAGTLQATRYGIEPVTRKELAEFLRKGWTGRSHPQDSPSTAELGEAH